MKTCKIITTIATIILIAAAVCFIGQFHVRMETSAHTFEVRSLLIGSLVTSFLSFFVVFMATKNWFEFFRAGSVKVHILLLILGLLLFIFGMIPNFIWVMYYRALPTNPYKTLFYSSYVRLAVSALSGVVIGKAFVHKKFETKTDALDMGDTP